MVRDKVMIRVIQVNVRVKVLVTELEGTAVSITKIQSMLAELYIMFPLVMVTEVEVRVTGDKVLAVEVKLMNAKDNVKFIKVMVTEVGLRVTEIKFKVTQVMVRVPEVNVLANVC